MFSCVCTSSSAQIFLEKYFLFFFCVHAEITKNRGHLTTTATAFLNIQKLWRDKPITVNHNNYVKSPLSKFWDFRQSSQKRKKLRKKRPLTKSPIRFLLQFFFSYLRRIISHYCYCAGTSRPCEGEYYSKDSDHWIHSQIIRAFDCLSLFFSTSARLCRGFRQ